MATKIQLRAGEVEFTFESDNPVGVSDIKDFIAQVQDLAQSITPAQTAVHTNDSAISDSKPTLMIEGGTPQLHVNSIAERLHASSGPDVAVAAAAYLQIVEGKQNFNRRELLETMKTATNVYNQNMGSNLSATIRTLSGTKLNQLANDSYSLRGDEIKDLRGRLTDGD